MARRLRHEDPRQGREHFDLRAGLDWEFGPDPNDIEGSTPDISWNKYKSGSRVIHSKGIWAVTDFGLQLLSHRPERNDIYEIEAYALLMECVKAGGIDRYYSWPILLALEPWADLEVFEAFEDCFYAALPVHCRTPLPVPQTLQEAVLMHFQEQLFGKKKKTLQDQPCCAEAEILERTFREARAIVQQRAAKKRIRRRDAA